MQPNKDCLLPSEMETPLQFIDCLDLCVMTAGGAGIPDDLLVSGQPRFSSYTKVLLTIFRDGTLFCLAIRATMIEQDTCHEFWYQEDVQILTDTCIRGKKPSVI